MLGYSWHGSISIGHCGKAKHNEPKHQKQELKSFHFLFLCFVSWCYLILNEAITTLLCLKAIHQETPKSTWRLVQLVTNMNSRFASRRCTGQKAPWTGQSFGTQSIGTGGVRGSEKDGLKNYLRTGTFSSQCWDGMTGLVVAFFALRSAYIPVAFLSCNVL